MKLLLAEDERQAGEYLVKGLGENGWIVDWVQNGVDAVHMAGHAEYDVIVLDVGLPKMGGWEAIKRIRHDSRTPVLFLTARDRVEDRVRGLELGADDYLVKPFAFSELLARVRALARRGKQQEPDVLRVADLEVQLLRRRRGGGHSRLRRLATPSKRELRSRQRAVDPLTGEHVHEHTHERLVHAHPHYPDLHHRHSHP